MWVFTNRHFPIFYAPPYAKYCSKIQQIKLPHISTQRYITYDNLRDYFGRYDVPWTRSYVGDYYGRTGTMSYVIISPLFPSVHQCSRQQERPHCASTSLHTTTFPYEITGLVSLPLLQCYLTPLHFPSHILWHRTIFFPRYFFLFLRSLL